MDAEGCWLLLQRSRLGALPSISTNVAPRLSCAAVRLPMQHDGRAPRSYRGGFGSIPNVGSGNPENIARAMEVGTATAGISLGEKPAFQAVPAEFESQCPLCHDVQHWCALRAANL